MSPHTINIEAIRGAERVYRSCLIEEPADTATRLRLAWCLLIQAVHADGRQSSLRGASEGTAQFESDPQGTVPVEVGILLEDCLRQTTAVMHLSRNEVEHADVRMLQNLINIAAADAEENPVMEESRRRIREITHAIVNDSCGLREPQRPRFRRVRVRRNH